MDKTYKFEFELTEEQVKEMEKALQNHQDTYYERDVELKPLGMAMLSERRETLDKFMKIEEIMNQFNLQLVKYKLG